jgi:hypothetical protein
MEAVMAGLLCTQCGERLGDDDAFCGNCGASAPGPQHTMSWPGAAPQYGGTPNGQPNGALSAAGGGVPLPGHQPFFWHEPTRPPGPLTNATRYLCAAAYLSNSFAKDVIRALITTRRAVAQSLHLDLGPIIWHCQRARRHILIRNIALVAIVMLMLFVSVPATINFLAWDFLLGWLLPRVKWRQRGLVVKILFVYLALSVLPLIFFLTFWLAVGTLATVFLSSGGSLASVVAGVLEVVGTFILLLALAWGTEFVFTYVTFHTLIKQLAPGAPPPPPAPGPASDRIAMVGGAQWGNITLYATEDPFIGAGVEVAPEREWSIAIRLDPADTARQVLRVRPATGAYVRIDPVELHQAIREKLRSLNDPALPPNERVAGLSVTDRLVGSGLLRWDSPLVDKSRMTPYSAASPEAVAAIIRHPQAGLRFYQHVAISDEGPPVLIGDRRVLDGADQGIAISAFVYTAVEGRHFYLQFIMTALPPIHPDYRGIDLLPALSSGRMLGWMIWHSLKRFLRDTADAPAGIISAFFLWLHERRTERDALRARGTVAGDLGAEVSVRELGTWDRFGSHIRLLDLEKYNSIIERAVLETVQDFLSSKGVDISAFSSTALNIINGNVIGSISGSGNNIGGAGSAFNQQQAGRPRQPRGSGAR